MRTSLPSPSTLAYLWAGISIGGPFLAVPAKFQVGDLPLELALQVGQAQFHWIGIAELITALALVGAILAKGWRANCWFVLPISVYFAQYTMIFPLLDARTTATIAGELQAPSNLHWIFIGFEIAKTSSLLLVAAVSNTAVTATKENPEKGAA